MQLPGAPQNNCSPVKLRLPVMRSHRGTGVSEAQWAVGGHLFGVSMSCRQSLLQIRTIWILCLFMEVLCNEGSSRTI